MSNSVLDVKDPKMKKWLSFLPRERLSTLMPSCSLGAQP